jgi:hypothetical protein
MNHLSLKTIARLAPAVFALGLGATAVQAESYSYDTGRDVTFISTDAQVINHYQTVRQSFTCPNGMRLATFSSDGALARNTSSSGVAAYLWDGSEGGTSLTETFTN